MDKCIGAQLFTVRDYMKTIEDFDATCKKISEIGYKKVQVSGTSLKAGEMREVLDKYGLKVVTTHRSFDDFIENIDEIIEYNKILGSDLCGVGMMPMRYAQSNEELTGFIAEANKICDILKKEKMYFGYHNHALEFAKHNGKMIFERLVEETNPEIFNFIADVYWIQVGGKNPADVIKNLGKRAMAVHFKDYFVNLEDWVKPKMTEIGNGNLDWDAIISICDKVGTKYILVEQDGDWIDGNPFKALSRSYVYLKTKGFC